MSTENYEAPAIVGHFIGGKVVNGLRERHSPVYNPTLGKVVRSVSLAERSEIDEAVAIAAAAQKKWGRTPALTRARVMFRFKELLVQNAKLLARVLSEEHGKTLADAEGDDVDAFGALGGEASVEFREQVGRNGADATDRKSTRLNSSHT